MVVKYTFGSSETRYSPWMIVIRLVAGAAVVNVIAASQPRLQCRFFKVASVNGFVM